MRPEHQMFSSSATTLPAPWADSGLFRAASSKLPPAPPVPVFGSFPKVCGCGAVYTASDWAQLPDRKPWDQRREGGPLLEQRRCPCGSHICITLEE